MGPAALTAMAFDRARERPRTGQDDPAAPQFMTLAERQEEQRQERQLFDVFRGAFREITPALIVTGIAIGVATGLGSTVGTALGTFLVRRINGRRPSHSR